jgi:hypothetical protein
VSTCADKVRYDSKAMAKLRARRLHSRGREKSRPYRCPACGMWHLTSTSAAGREYYRALVREGEGDA